ncbi:LysM peptidoglycan-binding domain-containing protein [Candidatus Enterococcus huntleyi]|uniref:LysM peptidoglycan-binding domain-containing protein n=1 Tax=Candidatus Enterococcus huntleyi TaxID=1857217 RepID=UPI00137B1A92|nr:LysM peptidoglycan-binding domain-containing protein [Enterococcus sp. JM4C]
MILSTFGIVGTSLIGATQVSAETWVANTPESIQIKENDTSYIMKKGDTLWAIATRININVETLAAANGIDLASGQQYYLQVGTKISWADGVVKATDVNGKAVNKGVKLTDDNKVVKDKPVGENVQKDVKTGKAKDSDVQGTPVKPVDKNDGSTQTPSKPTTPTAPVEPTKPAKPTTPAEPTEPTTPTEPTKPVTPTEPKDPDESKELTVLTVRYVDVTSGTPVDIINPVEVQGTVGESVRVQAKEFNGYILQGTSYKDVVLEPGKHLTTFEYIKSEKPNEETPDPMTPIGSLGLFKTEAELDAYAEKIMDDALWSTGESFQYQKWDVKSTTGKLIGWTGELISLGTGTDGQPETPNESEFTVDQVLYSKGGFKTEAAADAHADEMLDKWFDYSLENNIAIVASWGGSSSTGYTVTIRVSQVFN